MFETSARTGTAARRLASEARGALPGPRTATCAVTGLTLSLRPLVASSSLEREWHALSARALVANVFYEPEFAMAAALPFGGGVMLVAAHADGGPQAPLLGVWPVRVSRLRWGLPVATLLGWSHPFAASGVPLVDRDRGDEALTALFGAASAFGLPTRALLPLVPDEGPFAELLGRVAARLKLRESRTEEHDRAYLTPTPGADVTAHLSSGSRSKLRQEMRRLEKDGPVTLESVRDAAAVPAALEDYLRLEAEGWKGRMGTAIPSSPAETQFMRELVGRLAGQGRVSIDRLLLGQRVVASSITYRNGSTAWYAKISHDEEFAKNSPGSQLVLKVTEGFNADRTLAFVDSCAPPLHPLMRRFWPERMALANRLVELGAGDALFPLAALLERKRPLVRAWYHALKAKLGRA